MKVWVRNQGGTPVLIDLDAFISALTEETAPAIDDFAAIYDISAGANRKMTLANLFKLAPGAGRNRLINGGFAVDQRGGGASTARADDTYCLDRWYVLTQTASVNVSRQADQEDGTPYNIRLAQNQAAAQRMGIAQIIEGKDCKDLRSQSAAFRARVRISNSQAIRYAIVNHNGTEDAVTSDIVNDWTSSDYTDGAAKFFVDANLEPVVTGSMTPAANTWTTLTAITANLGAAFNNVIVFIWTEGTAAQNATLDIGRAQFEKGSASTTFECRDIATDTELAQRFYEKSYNIDVVPGTITFAGVAQQAVTMSSALVAQFASNVNYAALKRTTPSVTTYSPQNGTSGKIWDNANGADVNSSVANNGQHGFQWSASLSAANSTANLSLQWTSDAEL